MVSLNNLSRMLRNLIASKRLMLGCGILSTVVVILNIRGVSDYLKETERDFGSQNGHNIPEVNTIGVNGNHTREWDRFNDPGYIDQRRPHQFVSEHFRSRQDHLQQMCLQKGIQPPSSLVTSQLSSRMVVSPQHAIVYCPVQKVASTFWTKTLTAINSRGRYDSPYHVKPGSNYKPISYKSMRRRETLYQRFLSQLSYGVSLIVVRDPYTKLFSAYADKFYHPNWLYWRTEGVEVQKLIGKRVESPGNLLCGNDVTFSDFIKYIIYLYDNGMKADRHFTTITEHCHPCHTRFDYISKLETFKDDTLIILEDWKKRFNININFNDFEKETAFEIAHKHIRLGIHTMLKYADKCNISYSTFYIRIWRFLQISGILPKESEMPFTENGAISADEYYSVVEAVLSRNITWATVKRQRREALEQAYNTVDRQLMAKLRDIVRDDCNYFQYNDQPKSLFQKHTAKYDVNFQYFPGLKEG